MFSEQELEEEDKLPGRDTGSTPRPIVVQAARLQGGFPAHEALCLRCKTNRATDPHHWLFKRGSGVSRLKHQAPEWVLHHLNNVVLLCHPCHDDHGQTKDMFNLCCKFKVEICGIDPQIWMEHLQKHHQIVIPSEVAIFS